MSNNKERLQKKLVKNIKVFLKKKEKKKSKIWLWTTQTSTRRWKKELAEYGKKYIIKWEKKGKDLESSFDKAKYQDVFRVSNFEAINFL